jgi:outer membrane protein
MKKVIYALLFVAFSMTASNAQKIAVVDINAVLAAVPEYTVAEKEIERISSEWRQEISKEYDKIKSMYNKYQAEQVLLSDDAKVERENEIIKKEEEVRELQRLKFGPEGELFKKRQQMVAPIQDKVFTAIQDYAGARGFDLMFDKSSATGLLFTSTEFDKTEDIIAKVKK